jgi:hypothetical protein
VRTSISAAAITGAVLVGIPPAAGAASGSPQSSAQPSASRLFSFADSQLGESSGLAPSSDGKSVFTHNDSGDSARFFRIDARGDTVAVYTLRGATNVDWEDMATGTDSSGRPVLYFGDIGDNATRRGEIAVYQVPEPTGPSREVPWVRYRFAYPDGAHDAEALLVEPRTHRIYIATKVLVGGGELYAAPQPLSTTAVNVLSAVRSVPAFTTSGDFSPDGSRVVLLTYLGAYWADGLRDGWHRFEVAVQRQNESISFTRDGSAVLVGSEGVHSSVYRVRLPASSALSAPTATSSGLPGAAKPGAPARNTRVPIDTLLISLGVVLVGIASLGWWRLRRGQLGDHPEFAARRSYPRHRD